MVEPLTDPREAVIVVVPSCRLVAWPSVAWLIAATPALDEFQATEKVKFWVAPFVKVPMALNCWFTPSGREGLLGVTAKDTNAGGVTVRMVEPVTIPKEAVIVVVPWARLVACPWPPVELPIAATAALDEFQATKKVKFWMAPFVKVPMALNRWVIPSGMEGLGGVTAKDTKAGGVTVRMVEPLTDPKDAVIAVVPSCRLVACPWPPVELPIAATAGFEEFQFTDVVRSATLPFLKKPVAANCCLSPNGIEGFVGD